MGCRDRSLTLSPSYEYKKMNLLFVNYSFLNKVLTLILGILTSSPAGLAASAGGASAGGASTAASSDMTQNSKGLLFLI